MVSADEDDFRLQRGRNLKMHVVLFPVTMLCSVMLLCHVHVPSPHETLKTPQNTVAVVKQLSDMNITSIANKCDFFNTLCLKCVYVHEEMF